MAQADKGAWVLALFAAALGSGAFGRYLLGRHQDGLVFWLAFLAGVVLLALPLLVAEASLGQSRRRNAVDAFGPGRWALQGWLATGACVLLAGVLAHLAAVSGRLAYDSFLGDSFDDPDRHLRLITQGWDTMVLSLGAILVALATARAGQRDGPRGALTAVAVVSLLAIGALFVYALVATHGGTDAALRLDRDALTGSTVVAGLQQALVPAFVGLGLVATLSGRVHDRTLPREAALLATLWLVATFGLGTFLAAVADEQGAGLGDSYALSGALHAFAAVGGTEGGILSGTFFGVLLAGSLAALVAVLQVPAAVVAQRVEGASEGRGALLAGLAGYLVAIWLAFAKGAAADVGLLLAAVVAPLGGLLLSLHVGWARPEVLDGFLVGDAGHHLDRLLRPVLRYVLPLPLLVLLVLGVLQLAVHAFGADAGGNWLWDLVP